MENNNNKFIVEDLEVNYNDFRALKEVTIDIKANAITSIIGPSGCGKSTFLRAFNRMNDLIPNVSTNGLINKDGKNIRKQDIESSAIPKRCREMPRKLP